MFCNVQLASTRLPASNKSHFKSVAKLVSIVIGVAIAWVGRANEFVILVGHFYLKRCVNVDELIFLDFCQAQVTIVNDYRISFSDGQRCGF